VYLLPFYRSLLRSHPSISSLCSLFLSLLSLSPSLSFTFYLCAVPHCDFHCSFSPPSLSSLSPPSRPVLRALSLPRSLSLSLSSLRCAQSFGRPLKSPPGSGVCGFSPVQYSGSRSDEHT